MAIYVLGRGNDKANNFSNKSSFRRMHFLLMSSLSKILGRTVLKMRRTKLYSSHFQNPKSRYKIQDGLLPSIPGILCLPDALSQSRILCHVPPEPRQHHRPRLLPGHEQQQQQQQQWQRSRHSLQQHQDFEYREARIQQPEGISGFRNFGFFFFEPEGF